LLRASAEEEGVQIANRLAAKRTGGSAPTFRREDLYAPHRPRFITIVPEASAISTGAMAGIHKLGYLFE